MIYIQCKSEWLKCFSPAPAVNHHLSMIYIQVVENSMKPDISSIENSVEPDQLADQSTLVFMQHASSL